jgi:hypothetical protein
MNAMRSVQNVEDNHCECHCAQDKVAKDKVVKDKVKYKVAKANHLQ